MSPAAAFHALAGVVRVEHCLPIMPMASRTRRAAERGLSAVEVSGVFCVLATGLAMAVPACIRATRLSRTSEATDNLRRLANGYVAYRAGDAAHPALSSTPLTPSVVPRGAEASDPPGTWQHPTFQALEFSIDEPHWYSYEVQIDPSPNTPMRAVAHGDLDGDGVLSTYSIEVARDGRREVLRPGLYVEHELE